MKQFEIWLIDLDPTSGAEINKIRPCVIISPDTMNKLKTRLVAPMTTAIKPWPFRPNCVFQGKKGQIALDQMRCVDLRGRKLRKIGALGDATANTIKQTLQHMFS